MPFLMPSNRRRTPKIGMQFSHKLQVIGAEPDNKADKLKPDKIHKHVDNSLHIHQINAKYINHANVQDSFRKYRINKLKLKTPISHSQSRWFIDIFDEYDFLLDIEKKRRIAALRISGPVNVSQWNNDNDWYTHNIYRCSV